MLAQNFMSAEALGITDKQLTALIKTLGFFERCEVPDGTFWMALRDCGTAACLLGWANRMVPGAFGGHWNHCRGSDGLARLFIPDHFGSASARACRDPAKGAHALRNYLTTGSADWEAVMAAD